MSEYDLAVIGGGIHGTGIARDAAGRGMKVLLVEQNDLASGASSATSKIVHGGFHALQQQAVGPVREALAEREVLLRAAPHLVTPMRFVLPPQGVARPALLQRAELVAYDYLVRRRILPRSRTIDLTHHVCGAPLRRRYNFAFEFSDCRVDDARLVIANAIDAAMRGAVIRTRTRCIRADRAEVWTLVMNSRGRRTVVTARAVVNAAGPWLPAVSEMVFRRAARLPVRLVKTSHILVRALFDHDRGYLLPAADGRFVFVLPFASGLTLIGTSEQDFSGDPSTTVPGAAEIGYLCDTINRYFRDHVTPNDVVWSYAGVRCAWRDRKGASDEDAHDDAMRFDAPRGQAPLVSVYSGRLTTYRRMAEAALGRLGDFFAGRPRWTRNAVLPGGEFGPGGFEALVADVQARWPFLAAEHARRLARAYGSRVELVLSGVTTREHLGAFFGGDLTAAELRYLMRHEWAETPDDVLWRRSKLGLVVAPDDRERIARFMADELGADSRR